MGKFFFFFQNFMSMKIIAHEKKYFNLYIHPPGSNRIVCKSPKQTLYTFDIM